MSYLDKDKNTALEHLLDLSPLDPSRKEIRLLVVAPGAADDTICCKIQVKSLLEDLIYDAVSYAWSHVPGSETIVADNIAVEVPAAAEEVLLHLRYSDRPRILWIDAICINQWKNTERSYQVVLMHEIYRLASRTVVWLGVSDDSTAAAFSSLRSIHCQMCTESESGQKLREVLYGRSAILQYSSSSLPKDCDFAALRRLYGRPWFGRLWIVQEAASCTFGIVTCGKHEIGLIDLIRASVWIQHKQHQLPFDLDKESGSLNASHMSAYVDREQGLFSPNYDLVPSLADLLRQFRPFGVSESRDKIYALLGMTRWAASGRQLPESLIPRYQEKISVVLRDATRVAIEECKDLRLLQYVEHDSMAEFGADLPTWVPALFRKSNSNRDPNPLRSQFRPTKEFARYHSIPLLLRDSDPKKLFANGIELAKILTVGPVLGSEAKPMPDIQQLLYRTLVTRSVDDRSVPDALHSISFPKLVLALVGGSAFDPGRTQTSKKDVLKDRSFAQFVSALDKECEAIKSDPSRQRDGDFIGVLILQQFSKCLWAIRFACTNRRLFFTDTGRIGLGPRSSQAGDLVCVLSGSQMPIALRPVAAAADAGFEVVGPCYIDGMMRGGELAHMSGREIERQLRQFVLR